MEAIALHINGEDRPLLIQPEWTLLHVLREVLGFTGTKCGCETASCGACMVVVDGAAVKSCSIKAKCCVGKPIETIEGMARGGELHPIQQAFVEAGAVQCGYCTPGMVMSAKALLDQNPDPTEEEVREAIDQNLCRCTGYVKIVHAILDAARRMRSVPTGGVRP